MSHPDPTLLQIYAVEQAEPLQRMRTIVQDFAEQGNNTAGVDELFRRAHTLKGASRAAGVEVTETLMHVMETALAKLRAREIDVTARLRALFLQALDAVERGLAALALEHHVAAAVGRVALTKAQATGTDDREEPARVAH